MQAQHAAPESDGQTMCAWFGLWVPLVVLAGFAVLGAFVASKSGTPGDYWCGLVLSICSLLLAFLRIKAHFDGAEGEARGFLLVDSPANLAIVVPLFAVLGLAGLFVAAAWDEGSLHDAGIAMFGASGLVVFLSLKSVYDALDRRG